MPVPTPHSGEQRTDFISRCISTLTKSDPNRSEDQVVAICHVQWRGKEGVEALHPHFSRILSLFLTRYGENTGIKKFWNFIHKNGLKPTLAYHPALQLRESFDWAQPYISPLRSDKSAKYYAIRCIHAIVSMNNKDYTDYPQMESAAKSMNFRPVNLNHDPTTYAPYPRTRLDYSKAEDFCVEGILRVDNQDSYFQKCLDHDESIPEAEWINQPSIEGRYDLDRKGYHFTAISLLQKGYSLPGDPLSEIAPLFEEKVGDAASCVFVDGIEMCFTCEDDLNESKQLGDDKPMDDPKSIEEGEGPINPEGAVCPQCGHKVTPDPTIEAAAINCPRCDTVMTRLPVKSVEALSEEEIMELFRPPFNGDINSYNKRFKKTKGSQIHAKNTVKHVGPVTDQPPIGLVEHQEALAAKDSKIADLTSELVTSEAQKRTHLAKISEQQMEIDTLRESLSDTKRVAGGAEGLKVKVGELTERIIQLEKDLNESKVSAEQLEAVINAKNTRINVLLEEVKGLNATIAKIKEQVNTLRVERNDLSVKARASEEKALNETRERSRIQNEEADHLDKMRELTRDVSNLSERVAKEAKAKLKFEEEIAELQGQLRTNAAEYKEKLDKAYGTIEEAKKFSKWAWNNLKKAGYAVLDMSDQKEE